MTVVASLKMDDQVWLVSDRQISWGSFVRSDMPDFSKVVRFRNAFLASSGRSLYGNALRHIAQNNKELYEHSFEDEFDVNNFFLKFYEFIKTHYQLGSPEQNDVASMSNAQFLIVTDKKIFEVAGSRDVTEFANYTAIGSGYEITIGAIHALSQVLKDPADILKRAFQTCIHHRSCCGGEMIIINATEALKKDGDFLTLAASGRSRAGKSNTVRLSKKNVKEKPAAKGKKVSAKDTRVSKDNRKKKTATKAKPIAANQSKSAAED